MSVPPAQNFKEVALDLSGLTIQRGRVMGNRSLLQRKRMVFLVIGALFTIALVAWTWRSYTNVAVRTAAVSLVYPSHALTVLSATGYVVAQRKASVASKATGRLEWLGVLEGSAVLEGEVVARLENRDTEAMRDQAAANVQLALANLGQGKADLSEAEQAFKRSEALVSKNLVTESAYDSAVARLSKARAAVSGFEAAVAVARANLRLAEVSLDQTLIRAPFNGIVLTRNANLGDTITPFSQAVDTRGAVVTIADLTTLEVEADVAESAYLRVKVGQPVEIQLDAMPGQRFEGVVSRLVPTVDRAKASTLVKIRFVMPDLRILPEMSAKIAFLNREIMPDERHPVLTIPSSAALQANGKSEVFIIENGRARIKEVKFGKKIGEFLEISGLKAGTRVIVRPLEDLSDGLAVVEDAK